MPTLKMGCTIECQPWYMPMTFRQRRLRRLYLKAILLLLLLGLGLGVYWLVLRYWHILDAYVYTLEFHIMFQANNLAAANLRLFTEYFRDMGLRGQLWVMALLSLFIQNFRLPWTPPVVGLALVAAFGPAAGSLVSFLLLLVLGWCCFGLGIFFLGDILPLRLGEEWWRSRWQGARWLKPLFLGALALPVVPLSLIGAAGGLLRLPLLAYAWLLPLGIAVRTVLVLGLFFLFRTG